jgi:hypothetical protein
VFPHLVRTEPGEGTWRGVADAVPGGALLRALIDIPSPPEALARRPHVALSLSFARQVSRKSPTTAVEISPIAAACCRSILGVGLKSCFLMSEGSYQ